MRDRGGVPRRLAVAAATLLAASAALPAGAVEKSVTDAASFAGQSASTALRVAIGDIEIMVAGGDSMATYERSRVDVLRLKVDDRFLTACGADAVAVSGASECVSRAELRAINFKNADADTILGDDLVAAGIASYVPEQSSATLGGQDATATSKGIVIPGLATGEAACSSAKLAQDVVALATPDELEPAIVAKVGSASCKVSVSGLPNALHSSGEIAVDLTLTRSLVQNVPQLKQALDDIQDGLASLPAPVSEPVNNAIDAIQDELDAHPVLSIRVAPNRGTVDSSDGGISSAAPGVAVSISVLGGIVELEIGIAKTAASVLDGTPSASADVAFVKIKALNITTPDQSDAIIDQEIAAPADLSLLAGTPLATDIVTNRGTTSTTCPADSGFTTCASAVGDALSLRTLAAPLPTLSVDLVHAEAQAAARFTKVAAAPVLPATGPWAAGTVLGGLGLAASALLVRRRLL